MKRKEKVLETSNLANLTKEITSEMKSAVHCTKNSKSWDESKSFCTASSPRK